MELLRKDIPGADNPFWIRLGSSDEALYHVLIDQDEYGYICFSHEPKVIIDAGANIGLSAVIFALQYPSARIYALEPEPENYAMLKMNTASYPNITPVWGALMASDGLGTIIDPGKGELAYQMQIGNDADIETEIPCMTMETLCKRFNIIQIDLLKMDIEGTESAVFNEKYTWLSNVSTMIIELHDRLQPACNYTVFQAVRPYFHLEWIGGENFFFSKPGIAAPVIPDIFKTINPKRLPVEEIWSMQERLDMQNTEFSIKSDLIYQRIDLLEALYRRVDELEGLYRRVDELEGLYRRVDKLEGLSKRIDVLEERLKPFVHTVEQLRNEVDILCQAPLNRLYTKRITKMKK